MKTKNRRHKRADWSPKEEQLLIEAWAERADQIRGLRKNLHVYDELRLELEEYDCKFSVDEIKIKIHNLTAKYRKEKLQMETGPQTTWQWYSEVHQILGKYDEKKLSFPKTSEEITKTVSKEKSDRIFKRKLSTDEESTKTKIEKSSALKLKATSMKSKPQVEYEETDTRPRRTNWLPEEEKLLMEVWRDNVDELASVRKTRHIYERMQSVFEENDCDITVDELIVKVHNFARRYRKDRLLLITSGGKKTSRWEWFNEIHSFLGNRLSDEQIKSNYDKPKRPDVDTILKSLNLSNANIANNNEIVAMEADNESNVDDESRLEDSIQESCSDEEHIEDCDINKGRRAVWSLKQEKILLNAWGDRIDELRNPGKHRHIYKEIQLKLRASNFNYTVDEVRFKTQNLSKRYRRAILEIGPSGEPPSSWALFWDVHNILWKFEENNYDEEVRETINNLPILESDTTYAEHLNESFMDDEIHNLEIEQQDIENSSNANLKMEEDDAIPIMQDDKIEENPSENQNLEETNKNPRSKWGLREDKLLIKAWGERIDVIKKRKNLEVYEEIQEDLEKYDCCFTVGEIRNKIYNFTQRYRKELTHIETSNGTPSDGPFFWKVHNFLWSYEKHRFSNKAQCVVEQLEKSTRKQRIVTKKRAVWTLREEKMLIKAWSKKLIQLRRKKNRHIYEEMQSELCQQFCNVSVEELINKIHNLKCRYRKEKRSLPSDWPLYDDIEKLLMRSSGEDELEDNLCDSTMQDDQFENSPEDSEDNTLYICRICLQEEEIMDWNEELYETSGISFKDCYYKYTQLQEIESDPLPQFLCQSCLTDLKTIHIFIEKALDAQQLLESKLYTTKDNLNERYTEQEGEEHENESAYNDQIEEAEQHLKIEIHTEGDFENTLSDKSDENTNATDNEEETEHFEHFEFVATKSPTPEPQTRKYILQRNIPNSKSSLQKKKQTRLRHGSRICSYCSKVCGSVHRLKNHELTHQRNRKPEAICPICGMKLLNKSYLPDHLYTHDQNREKRFKCEFCDKAFYSKPYLSTHRKMHLGNMIKCPQCPKEYFKQDDLDRHLQKHSIAPLASAKPKIKYVVHCKECDRDINSDLFKEHRAIHRNEPEMRCTACEKDLYGRRGFSQHMKAVHNRKVNEWDDITYYYMQKRPRLSHKLLIEQEEVKPKLIPE